MLRRQHHVGHAEYGVDTGGEDADLLGAIGDLKVELDAFAAADPVRLHDTHALGPLGELGEVVEESVSVVSDLEEPLLAQLLADGTSAAPALAAGGLLVGEDELALGAPVDWRAGAIGEAAREELQEEPLVPAVIAGIAGDHFPVPVVAIPKLPELAPHAVDAGVCPFGRMSVPLHRGGLGRLAEGVEAHRV